MKRLLTESECRQLEAQGCRAESWDKVWVAEGFCTDFVREAEFSGTIQLGVFSKKASWEGGISQHSGIYRARLHDCSVGDDTLIMDIHNYIAHYDIGADCQIVNSNLIVATKESTFGNNTLVSVLNETGGREVPLFDRLSAPLAYIIALYRHRPELICRLMEMISAYSRRLATGRGTIGKGTKIINAGTLRDVRIGEFAKIENVTRLQNGSVNSTEEEPVYVGDSVIAEDFIISSGAEVSDAAKLVRCFVGQSCRVSHNFSAHDSLLFSNCVFENGEVCAIFAGPFTVSMHKSSLLIAGMYSFLNAGSGSNQSNHMYKLGPIHQGIVERGSKTTSDSYILWPARIGAFSLVMGRHYHHSDTSNIPFSYLIEKNDESYLMPGVNLRSVGTIRDAQKWPKRDKRRGTLKLDPINYNLLSPYTIQKMMKAVSILKELQSLAGATSDVYYYQNTRIKRTSLLRGLELYRMAIEKFLGNSLISRLQGQEFENIEDIRRRLRPDSNDGQGEWLDLSGLILPARSLNNILEDVEQGRINQIEDLENFFQETHARYYSLEWDWAYEAIESFYGLKLQEVEIDDLITLIRRWEEAVVGLDNLLYEDARKEFSLTSMTGFGVDGSETEKRQDFEGVRGAFESNPFVTAVKQHIEKKRALGRGMIERLEKAR